MIQTLEAVVNESGKIELLTEIRLKKRQRALVTILDEDPKTSIEETETPEEIKAKKERLFAAFKKAQEIGLFAEIENPKEWQRELRDEWE